MCQGLKAPSPSWTLVAALCVTYRHKSRMALVKGESNTAEHLLPTSRAPGGTQPALV